ncbi:hypothetical protein XENORESO_017961 [Xenotaenia resolanae]|uniref:DZF domain-containing protein n=1 Tax=Xenotaenia resolanae TaxID=208358 RepID=A0ABV0VS04_9TELE
MKEIVAPPKQTGPQNRLVMTKHSEVYPSAEDLQSVQTIISHVEHAFKTLSEQIDGGSTRGEERFLRGLMRVGLVAKGLLLKGDKELKLVLLCSSWPTITLFNQVTEQLTKQLEVISAGTYAVSPCLEEAAIVVKSTKESGPTLAINLTSPLVRTEQLANAVDGKGVYFCPAGPQLSQACSVCSRYARDCTPPLIYTCINYYPRIPLGVAQRCRLQVSEADHINCLNLKPALSH